MSEQREPQPRPLLEARALCVHFPARGALRLAGRRAKVRAVDGLDLTLDRGRTLGLVGESGCGKSTAGRALLQLIRPTSGSVTFDGVELTALWRRRFGLVAWSPELRALRNRMQMVFQDPYASLDPRMTVEEIVAEPLQIFERASGLELRRQVQALLAEVGMDPQFVRRYPHEFSGGQRQRIGIARALAGEPEFLVADEPVSALDVSIQAQVMNLLQDLQEELGLALLFIAHDLSVVEHISDRVIVMYLGRIMEIAPVRELFLRPRHPYTEALLSAAPVPDPKAKRERIILQGDIPSPAHPPSGCVFRTRCRYAKAECASIVPPPRAVGPGHVTACIRDDIL
jgi:oligopeptide/dipeptide ABC transporter ATP-binding protein